MYSTLFFQLKIKSGEIICICVWLSLKKETPKRNIRTSTDPSREAGVGWGGGIPLDTMLCALAFSSTSVETELTYYTVTPLQGTSQWFLVHSHGYNHHHSPSENSFVTPNTRTPYSGHFIEKEII